MLLHLRPRFYSRLYPVELVELKIEALGLHLRGGVELATRKPYHNKCYSVGCRRKGLKAYDGIAIKTTGHVAEFESVACWAVNASYLAVHRITYRLLDDEYDTATDDTNAWEAIWHPPDHWESRRPSPEPAHLFMDDGYFENYGGEVIDTRDARGRLIERRQLFQMPSVQQFRLAWTGRPDRIPPEDHAFVPPGRNPP